MWVDLRLAALFGFTLSFLFGCEFSDTVKVSTVVEETDIISNDIERKIVHLPFHTVVERDGNKIIVLQLSVDLLSDVKRPTLLMTRAGLNVQVFLDQEWIYGQSFLERPMAQTWNTPQLVQFSRSQLDTAKYIRIKLFAFAGDHTLLEPIYLGEYDRLKSLYNRFRFFQNQLTLSISVATSVLLVVSLLLWIASGRENSYLIAIATSLSLIVACQNYFVVNTFLTHTMLQAVTHTSLDWLGVFVAMWIMNIKGLHSGFSRLLFLWGFFSTLVNIMVPGIYRVPFVEWLHYVSIGIVVLVLLAPVNSDRANSAEVFTTRMTGVIGCSLCLIDMVVQARLLQVPGLPRFVPITFFLIFISNNVILLNRFARTYKIARRSQEELESIVAKREADLDRYHAQNTILESQQARSEERERIMRDLHDGMGGHLVSALAVAKQETRLDDRSQNNITDSLQTALVEMRMLITNSANEYHDLGEALGSLRATIEPLLKNAGVELHWRLDPFGKMPILTVSERMHVVRIMQECFTNVIKHSNASSVTVSTRQAGARYRVQIENSGTVDYTNRSGNGVRNMQYRAEMLNGSFELKETGGKVTAVLEFPFDQESA